MEDQQVNTKAPTGLVLNIQHFCTHDGPASGRPFFLRAARFGASGVPIPRVSTRSRSLPITRQVHW